MPKNKCETIKDLTLMLLYLSSWEDKDIPPDVRRAWKGYNFSILNELTDEDLINGAGRRKSAYIFPEGVEKAEKLLEEYGIKIEDS